MRSSLCFLAPLLLLAIVGHARAQDEDPPRDDKKPKPPPIRFEKIRVGFLRYEPDEIGNSSPHYKPGMFNPVLVTIKVGEKPIPKGKLSLETPDSESERTITTQEFGLLDEKKLAHFQGIVMPGNMAAEVKVTIDADGRSYEAESGGVDGRLDLSSQLILTLGSRVPDLRSALVQMSPRRALKDKDNNNFNNVDELTTWPRFAAYEDNVEVLPEHWTGYQAVDLMILTTKSEAFVNGLAQPNDHARARLKAISQWVRRGGRLVLSMSWENQEKVADLLRQPVWQPPLPVRLPDQRGDIQANAPEGLPDVQSWASSGTPFINPVRNAKNKIPIAQLTPPDMANPDWTVLAEVSKEDKRPVMVRVPYGLGSVTIIGFALDDAPFSLWKGRHEFWRKLVEKATPRAVKPNPNEDQFNRRRFDDYSNGSEDLVSSLHRQLDNFDVKIVPFGWVALFILLYIIVVGPLDYVLLKYVFKRLEWTWITFPVVVFAVSFAAYFTAYAIKGKELRINQVDVLDFDLRTQLDEKQRPAKAYIYGQSFFTLLSPHIQNYTIGLEPNPAFWGQTAKSPMSADSLTWVGKAESDYNGMGSNARQSLFRRPYYFAEDAVGLRGVPIPVWTTKCFTATWDAPALPQMPFTVDLKYHAHDRDIIVSGTFTNNLPVDLEDVWIFYRNKIAKVPNLPGKNASEQKIEVPSFELKNSSSEWVDKVDRADEVHRTKSDKGIYNPTSLMKRILFYENTDVGNALRDQRLRALDQSWRLQEDNNPRHTGVREAVLYARVKYRAGEGEELYTTTGEEPLPTRIWLGDLPGRKEATTRPALHGTLNHDTYIRILVPLRWSGS